MYTTEQVGNWVDTKQTEIPVYGSDRLGLVRRDLVIKKGLITGDGDPTGGGDPPSPERSAGVIMKPAVGQLRIVEVLHDGPLTEPGNEKNDNHLGEYVVLRNTSGGRLWPGEVELGDGSKYPSSLNNAVPSDLKRLVDGMPDSEEAELWVQKRESRPQSIEFDGSGKILQQNSCTNDD